MRVFFDGGICLQEGIKEVVLDPHRTTPGSVVSHAHMDHLSRGALMTPETLAVMKVRLGSGGGKPLPIGGSTKYQGFDVKFHDAGHTFGSAMVQVNDVLYTGDFNPEGGMTCGEAKPVRCDTLIIESTYGKRGFSFPPKREVERDLLSWTESEIPKASVAFGAIEFGKAQELVALLNSINIDVAVADSIADIADIYNAHGHHLRYRRVKGLLHEERKEPRAYVVPRAWLGQDAPESFAFFKEMNGSTALVSGWCAVFNFSKGHDLTAQFPLSDHADFDDLIGFASACQPGRVYTVGGSSRELAEEIAHGVGIRAEPLHEHRRRKDGVGR